MFSPEEAKKEYTKHKFSPPDYAIVTEVTVPLSIYITKKHTHVLSDFSKIINFQLKKKNCFVAQNIDCGNL